MDFIIGVGMYRTDVLIAELNGLPEVLAMRNEERIIFKLSQKITRQQKVLDAVKEMQSPCELCNDIICDGRIMCGMLAEFNTVKTALEEYEAD